MKIVLASHNTGKIQEFRTLLQPFNFELILQSDLGVEEAEETGLSFVENAILKARHAARLTGLPAIADDSGLVVSALNGAPGIYSARYAGKSATAKENIEKLLAELKNTPQENRQADFYCVIVFIKSAEDPFPIICEGKWSGVILPSPMGEAGFGYDPIFYVPAEKKSAAQLPLALKNKISHRGLALQKLIKKLSEQ